MRLLTLILSLLCINALAITDEEVTAAEQGNSWKKIFLGDKYCRPPLNQPREGFKWYLKAVLQDGLPNHIEIVAECYLNGVGVTKDDVEAYAYYNISAVDLESSRRERDELSKRMTPSQIEAAQKRSKELLIAIEPAQEQYWKKFRKRHGLDKNDGSEKAWWQFSR